MLCGTLLLFIVVYVFFSSAPQKHALMERVAHQVIVMQYILELAKQLQTDPRSCVSGFFLRCGINKSTYIIERKRVSNMCMWY